MPIAIKVIIVVICSYFLGNITFARPLSKSINDDITTHGSGNPGTMNMMRTHGAKFGILTLVLDALKGVVSCLTAYYIFKGRDGGELAELMKVVAGFSCFIGHLYPVVYKFKGGKGVATACGIGFCINPLLMIPIAIIFIAVLFSTEIASLSSMTAVAAFILIHTIFYILDGYYFCLIPIYLILIFVIYAHRANIVRLIHGNENKVHVRKYFQKKEKQDDTNKSKEKVEEDKKDC